MSTLPTTRDNFTYRHLVPRIIRCALTKKYSHKRPQHLLHPFANQASQTHLPPDHWPALPAESGVWLPCQANLTWSPCHPVRLGVRLGGFDIPLQSNHITEKSGMISDVIGAMSRESQSCFGALLHRG